MISEHPVAACAAAVVGAIGLCTALTYQWVLPTMTASLTHSIELLKEEATKSGKETAGLKTKATSAEAEVTRLNSEVKQVTADKDKVIEGLRADLFKAQQANAFTKGYPYPVGLDTIKVGDPVEKIAATYPALVYETKTHKGVDTSQQLFTRVSFNFGRSEDNGEIEGITFDLGPSVTRKYAKPPLPTIPDGWLEGALRVALGSPKIIGPEEDCLVWPLENPEILVFYQKGEDTYFVSEKLSPGGCYITSEQRKQAPAGDRARRAK